MPLTENQKRAMCHSKSLCVTAGAGAGKTHTLVQKYISLLENGVGVSEILAVTFTDKAAGEMRHKVRKEILGKKGEKWDRIKDDLNWCQISTFHSFCANVIREFPLETGVAPGFRVLDEAERNELLQAAFDQLLSNPADSEEEKALVRLLTEISSGQLIDCLEFMFKRRFEISKFLDSFSTMEDLRSVWKGFEEEGRRKAVRLFLGDSEFMGAVDALRSLASKYAGNRDAGSRYLDAVSPFLDDIRADSEEAACQVILSLSKVKGSRNSGSEKVFGRDLTRFRSAYNQLQNAFDRIDLGILEKDSEELTAMAASMLVDLKTVFVAYQRAVKELKKEINAIDFEDMMEIVYDLFVRNKELLREQFTQRFRYILVDEFQDTDSIQSDLIWRIAGGEKCGERLFIVGDPKQSIYLFRNVDVSMFTAAEEAIKRIGGESIPLDVNFRSSPQVIGFVNYVFKQLMREANNKWEPEYQDMVPSKERERDEGSVELLLLPDADGSEAEFAARKIQEIVEKQSRMVFWSTDGKDHLKAPRPATYGDVAILLRARTHLSEFEEALRRYRIPYRVYAGLGFFQREEIVDLTNLLAFLDNEEDNISLYGVLRSPYFSFSDEQLFRAISHEYGSLWRKLNSYIDKEKDEAIEHAVKRLQRWLRNSHRLTVPQLITQILRESGIYAVYGGLPDGDLRIGNIEKLLDKAREVQSTGFLTLNDFKSLLRLSMEEEAKEGLAQLSEGDNAVKIMTVHAAKGLEFPIVIVPEMNFFRREDSLLLNHSDEMGIGLEAPDPSNDYELKDTLPKKLISMERASKESAERKRLLYVALTRAKDHLLMCGNIPDEKELEKELWINWILETTGLDSSSITNGFKKINEQLSISIISDPSSIDAEERSLESTDRCNPEEVAPFVLAGQPIELVPSSPTMSPSMVFKSGEADLRLSSVKLPEIIVEERKALDESPAIRGIIVHEVLNGKAAALVLRKHGVQDVKKSNTYSQMRDDLMSEEVVKNASATYRELPFLAKIDDSYYRGRIDLLTRGKDGSWNVVDYKTGSFSGKRAEARVAEYSTQMGLYRKAVESLLKTKVNAFLYLADECRMASL